MLLLVDTSHFAAATSFYGSISETFTFFEFLFPHLKVLQTAAKVGLFSISLLLINFPRQVNPCQLKKGGGCMAQR